MTSKDLLVVAGEASGDLHGARLLAELVALRPRLRAFGLGGDELSAAGLERVAHSSEIAVVGITEALKILRRARRIFNLLLAEVDRRGARSAILIDSPDFNLRLAKALKARGVQVIYYVSPQVWAWRRRRVHLIRRVVDKMLVLFPFEVDFYRRHGVAATFTGHPLVDEVPALPQVWDEEVGEGAPFCVALLPGSRQSEVERMLPTFVAAAGALARELPVSCRLIRAPTIPRGQLTAALAEAEVEIEVVSEDRFAAIAGCHIAFCAAGTATVEVGLLGTPMLVIYKVSAWTWAVARLLAHSPYASMVNLLLQREAVPELIQQSARPENICRHAVELLSDPGLIREMRAALAGLRPRLGEPGASRRAALEVSRSLVAD